MINRNNSHLTKTLSPNSFLFSFKEILAFRKPICIRINPNHLFSHAIFYPIPSISFPNLPVNTQLSLSPRIQSQAVSKETDISAMTSHFQIILSTSSSFQYCCCNFSSIKELHQPHFKELNWQQIRYESPLILLL